MNLSLPLSSIPRSILEARLEKRQLPRDSELDLGLVDVDPRHAVAQQCHAHGVGGAEVSRPDDGKGKADAGSAGRRRTGGTGRRTDGDLPMRNCSCQASFGSQYRDRFAPGCSAFRGSVQLRRNQGC